MRAERDAMAAELQIERAERLRAEERLRLFEREKLEQMREGAASREKLASELEESRLRAMRAEARQAAIEADLRLSEIAARRRGYWPPETGSDPIADEVAEPRDEGESADDQPAPEPEPAPEPPKFIRPGQAKYVPGSGVSKYSRLARGAARGGEAAKPAPGARSGRGDESAATGAPPADRPSDAGAGARGRTRMGDVEPPKWPSGPGGLPRTEPGAGPSARTTAGRDATAPTARGSAAGARGGAAAGRPTLDRANLEARLAAGARIEVTDRFRQFQPVTQSHIKICDWLARAQTLEDIDNLAAGELARSEIVGVLTLFFERSFLVFKS